MNIRRRWIRKQLQGVKPDRADCGKPEPDGMMVTHNMNDAIHIGNRLIMMHEGRIFTNVAGEEKKNLKVEDLLRKFEQASGGQFANDRMMLAR